MPQTCHHPSRFLRSIGGVFVAMVAALLVGPGAEASCGDWLEGHGTAMTRDHRPQDGSVDSTLAAGDRDARPSTPARRPCNGPSCGRAPAPLPFTPGDTPVVSIELERDAILSTVSLDDQPGIPAPVVTDEPVSSSALSGRPERPPRAA